MTVWIEWKEQDRKMTGRRYIGNGEDVPVFETITVTRRARYSNDVTPEMIQRAHDYVESSRPEAQVVVD